MTSDAVRFERLAAALALFAALVFLAAGVSRRSPRIRPSRAPHRANTSTTLTTS